MYMLTNTAKGFRIDYIAVDGKSSMVRMVADRAQAESLLASLNGTSARVSFR